jgi:hypothetical protein
MEGDKLLNVKVLLVESNFDEYFDEILTFCKKAEIETDLKKTKANMKSDNWADYPESLMFRLYKSKKYSNSNGALVMVYNGNELFSISGVEKHNKEIAIIAKRLYVLRKYRTMPIFSTFILNPQIEWAKKEGMKACLITINEYQRHTVLRIFQRAQKKSAVVLGKELYPTGNIFNEMKINPLKIFINGEYQYIISYLIDKNYKINFGEI